MKNKIKFWIIFLLIIIISWIDFQYFNEGYYSKFVPENTRQIAHIIVLFLIAFVGFFAWTNFPIKWMKKLWVYPYTLFLFVQIIVGVLQKSYHLLSKDFLDEMHTIRLIFSSPFPFLVLFFIYLLIKNGKLKT